MSKLKEMRGKKAGKSPMSKYLIAAIAVIVVAVVAIVVMLSLPQGNGGNGSGEYIDTSFTENIEPTAVVTFSSSNNEICTENGKPVISLYSTTWCPHCQWIRQTYDSAVTEYVNEGKIIAYHWEMDTGDNTLTSAVETAVPDAHKAIYQQFNPGESIPTYVFGCKYSRIGNGYENQKTTAELAQEAGEFKAVIEKIIEEAAQ